MPIRAANCDMRRWFEMSSLHLAYAGVRGFVPASRQAASSLASISRACSAAVRQPPIGSVSATSNKSRENILPPSALTGLQPRPLLQPLPDTNGQRDTDLAVGHD